MSRGIAKPGSARTWALAMIPYFINPSMHNSCEGSLPIGFGISIRLKFTAGDQEAVNYCFTVTRVSFRGVRALEFPPQEILKLSMVIIVTSMCCLESLSQNAS